MTDHKQLGKYELLEEIGHGGFATVYQARDTVLGRVVALKVLHTAHANQPDMVQRFLAEARRASRLRHNGIVRVLDVGEFGGQPFIAMEYLPGGTLAARLQGGPLPVETAVVVLEQLADALDYAHSRELIHRDIKPANVLFDEDGHAVLCDFGLVKSLLESGLTVEGTRLGTPDYMAPEQADPSVAPSPAADIYALGVVAYELLTGRVPFQADTPVAVLHAHVHSAPPDPCALNPTLDRGVAEVVLTALDKAPDCRHKKAGVFGRALRQAWEVAHKTAHARATLPGLYTQAQEAVKAGRWGEVVSLCVQMRNLDPDYGDVSTLLTLAARRLAEQDQKRQRA